MSLPHICKCGICGVTMRDYEWPLLTALRPCECVGCICVQQSSPSMMRIGTFCKMPRAQTIATDNTEVKS
jgi:hypothetical protein